MMDTELLEGVLMIMTILHQQTLDMVLLDHQTTTMRIFHLMVLLDQEVIR